MGIHSRFAASALFALALGQVPAAYAGDELYLRWDNCLGDGGIYNKVFACDTNSGAQVLVGSFRLAQASNSVSGLLLWLDVTSLTWPMPGWWQYQGPEGPIPAGCRAGSLSVSFAPPLGSSACLDAWGGQALGGVRYDYTTGSGVARIRLAMAVPSEVTLPGGQEIFAFQLRIDHARTVGVGSCAGCTTPVCLAWGWAQVNHPGGTADFQILGAETPNNGSNVTWQPGAVATTVGYCQPFNYCQTEVICESVTPARDHTWGMIKALYR